MPADLEYLRGLATEPFDGARHDRAPFRCGVDRIDNFLKNTASGYVKDDNGRIFLAVEREGGRIAGFYAMSPHAIDASSLDPELAKRLPRTDRISSFYLAMIAAHVDVQDKGVGGYLLADALKRCMALADQVGGRFVVLDAINDRAASLYARFGFTPLSSQPERMVVGMAKLRASERERQRKAGLAA